MDFGSGRDERTNGVTEIQIASLLCRFDKGFGGVGIDTTQSFLATARFRFRFFFVIIGGKGPPPLLHCGQVSPPALCLPALCLSFGPLQFFFISANKSNEVERLDDGAGAEHARL